MVIFHSLCKRLPEGNIHPNLTMAHMAIYIYEKKNFKYIGVYDGVIQIHDPRDYHNPVCEE